MRVSVVEYYRVVTTLDVEPEADTDEAIFDAYTSEVGHIDIRFDRMDNVKEVDWDLLEQDLEIYKE